MADAACHWCGQPFAPRASGGTPQAFCCPTHRRLFEGLAKDVGRRILAAVRDERLAAIDTEIVPQDVRTARAVLSIVEDARGRLPLAHD